MLWSLPRGLVSTGPWRTIFPWHQPRLRCSYLAVQGRGGVGSCPGCLRSCGKVRCVQWDKWRLWVCDFQGTLRRRATHHCQHVRSGLCCVLRLLDAPPLIGMCNLQTQHTEAERSCLLPASACALESFSMQMSKYKTLDFPMASREDCMLLGW